MSINGGGNTFYDLNAATGNTDFNGANLGTFATGSPNLVLKGAEHNVWKCGGCDLTSTRLYYRIYTAGSPSGAYTSLNIGYSSGGANGCGGENQQWANTGYSVDVLNSLGVGNYTIEVYSDASITCSGGTAFASNGGSNYRANFTVSCAPAAGFSDFASAIYIKNCTDTRFYNTTGSGVNCINPTCATTLASGSTFGTFNQNSDGFGIRGGEIKTSQVAGGNAASARLYYTVYLMGFRPGSPVFSSFNLPFKCGCGGGGTFTDGLGPCSPNDKKFSTEALSLIDLSDRAAGTYTLEIYYEFVGDYSCNKTLYINNGGSNYTANFTIVTSGGTCTLLPVELTNFSVNCYDEDVKITWTTASENRNDYFVVEKSYDGINWLEVEKIAGQGNSSHESNYLISDIKTIVDCYYRLKQVDFDGKTTFFEPSKLECYDDNSSFLEVIPNPNDGGKFEIYLKEKNRKNSTRLNLYDSAGKLIFNKEIEVNSGINKYEVNETLSAGFYYLEILNNDSYQRTKKIVVY
jgi:hypothetical protein